MKITLAEKRGFCFGVRRAIEMAAETARRARQTYSLGPLIHNPQEIERVAALGVKVAQRLEDIPGGGTVIIRSHGAAPQVLEANPHLEPERDGPGIRRYVIALARCERVYAWLGEQDDAFAAGAEADVRVCLGFRM